MSAQSNTRKTAYNIFFGVRSQVLLAAIGIVLPRLFLTTYGSEVNGFLSSINQVLTYVVLLEMGIGTASLQALYKPVATEDREAVSGILSATARFYRRTGLLYLLCVLVLAVVYPLAIRSDIPVWEQVAVILVVGGSGSIGYFFHAKYRILLNADGKQYIYTNIFTVTQIANQVLKIVLILLGMNIVFIQAGHMLLTLLLALYIDRYTRKHYPWLNMKAKPDKKAIAQKNNVVIHEVAQMVFNHTDVLILTIFTDLRIVSVYVTYNMVVDMVSTLIGNIHSGFVFRLGQLFNLDRERYKQVYDVYETCYMLLSSALYCITFLLLLPFMALYTRGVTDVNYLNRWLPLLFVAIKMLVTGRALSGLTVSFAQHFKETRAGAIIEMLINLFVSVIGVIAFGIYGVLFGTLAALIYRANDLILHANLRILSQSPVRTYLRWGVDVGTFVCVAQLARFFPPDSGSYFELIGKGVLYTVVTFAAFFLSNGLFFRKQIITAADHFAGMIKEKFLHNGGSL